VIGHGERCDPAHRADGPALPRGGPGAQAHDARRRLQLHGRGDTQHFRLQLPEVAVTKDIASDAKVRVEMRREFFNEMAKDAKVADWREAFMYGQAKATGPTQILQLIQRVVDKQDERNRQRRAKQH
jgi:hypothetical protein